MDEISILNQYCHGHPKDIKYIVTFLDLFKHSGPNWQHVFLVYEYFGDNLLSRIKYYDYKGMPLKMVKNICHYTLLGLDYLHLQHFISYTDLKPKNVLLVSTIESSKGPQKNGKPLILPPQKDNKIQLPFNSAFRKNPLSFATLKETNLPSSAARWKEPLISATPEAMVSFSNVGVTKNQKNPLENNSKKLALSNTKT